MLKLVLLTPNTVAADAIEQVAHEAGVFKLVMKGSPIPPAAEIVRAIRMHNADLVLVDIGDWHGIAYLLKQIRRYGSRVVVLGFRPSWNPEEQAAFEEAKISGLLREPFSPVELEVTAYEALHREHPVTNRDILAFLPAKAGGGCSTVTLNTAAATASSLDKKVLLVESDRRSGVLSIMLNLRNRFGLAEALANASDLTPVEWNQYYVDKFGIDMLLADPARQGPLPSWAGYYTLLQFLQGQYDYLFFDLPELVNQATAEVVKSARAIFIVCTPEVPSLKMASQRHAELTACEIPPENIHMVVNRWERSRFSVQDVEKILDHPVFGTLPNDYLSVTESILESRLVSPDSSFTESCHALARKLGGLPEALPVRPGFGLLKKLGMITS
jgi:MinD-like ATPase involved in chromosome partitioning or flagellar assembly